MPEHTKKSGNGIVEPIDDALLQRNDRIIRNGDAFRADFRAALGDVAQPDAVGILELARAIHGVQRMHLERGGVDQMARADKPVEQLMLAKHVTDVLAQKALDALSKFLN